MHETASVLLAGKDVLVVEDERLIALYTKDLLVDWGCKVLGPAATVSSALELIRWKTPNAAMLDFDLGGETSEPIAEALMEADCPFLVTTAFEVRHLGPRMASARVLRKPIDEEGLRRTLIDLFSSLRTAPRKSAMAAAG